MRRAIATFLGVLTALAPSAFAAEPGAGGGLNQRAVASWIRFDGAVGRIHMAYVERFVDPLYTGTTGSVLTGRCTKDRFMDLVWIECTARGPSKDLGPHEFWMDPALERAHMTMRARGTTHRVDWTGRGDVDLDAEADHGASGAWVVADGYRRARATARLFGSSFSKGCHACYMHEDVDANASTDGRHGIRFSREGDRLVARVRIRIER